MKAFAALLCLLPALALGQGYIPGGGGISSSSATPGDIEQNPSFQTQAAITLYVDSTGSDSNACTSSGTSACLTLQGAVDKVPKRIKHAVTINMAAGNFAGAIISGFVFEAFGAAAAFNGITVVGTLGATTVTTGSASGTFSSGTLGSSSSTTWGTATKAGEVWTVNDLIGKQVHLTGGTGSGQVRVIKTNTADTITIDGAWTVAPDATTTFEFVIPTTVINAFPGGFSGSNIGIYVTDCFGATFSQYAVVLKNLRYTTIRGVRVDSTTSVLVSESRFESTTFGVDINSANGHIPQVSILDSSFSSSGSQGGVRGSGPGFIQLTRSTISGGAFGVRGSPETNTGVGVGPTIVVSASYFRANTTRSLQLGGTTLIAGSVIDCVTAGSREGVILSSSTNGSVATVSVSEVSNCALGMEARGPNGYIELTGAVSGTANTRALRATTGGGIKVSSTATIASTSGDEVSLDNLETVSFAALRAPESGNRFFSNSLGSKVFEP